MRLYGPPVKKMTIMQFLLKYKMQFIVSSIAGIIYNTVIVLGPIYLGRLIDAAGDGTAKMVILSASYFLGVTVFFQFSRFIKRWYMRDQFNRVACDLRQTLLDKVLGFEMLQLEKESVGDLMSRTVGDITLVVDTVMSTLNEGWDTWLLMMSYFAVLMLMDWKITLLASLLVPMTLYFAHVMRHVLYECSLEARFSASTANSGLQRYLSAVSLLRLFGREASEADVIEKAFTKQVHFNIKQTVLQQVLLPVYAILAGVGVVIVIGLGGENVKQNIWSIGTFNAYMVMFIAFTGRTRVAAKVFNRWHGAKAAWTRIKEKMMMNTLAGDNGNMVNSSLNPCDLDVNDLCLSYDNRVVLDNVTFNAKCGDIIGITGAVGSGKTSLINALTGQYPYTGSIRVNGKPFNTFTSIEKQSIVAYSGHENYLFSMGIDENVGFDDIHDSMLKRSLMIASLDEDIRQFSNGVKSQVGEKGQRVSGGQRQRISVARALYKHSSVLLLDDPFSALDVVTEQHIINNLKTHCKDQVVIIATHRLTALKDVDKIIVLDKGRVIEMGTHDELMNLKGLYCDIFKAQNYLEGGNTND